MIPKVTIKKDLISHPLLVDKFASQKEQIIEQYNSSFIATIDKERQTVSFRNPFDIPRGQLVQQVRKYSKLIFILKFNSFKVLILR